MKVAVMKVCAILKGEAYPTKSMQTILPASKEIVLGKCEPF